MQEMLSHQAEEISRLSDEMHLQQKEIAQLRKQLTAMDERLHESIIRSPSEETPPPHY